MPVSASGAADIQSNPETGSILQWTVHPARRHIPSTTVVVAVAASVAVIGWMLFRSLLPALAGAVALLGSVSDFLLPSTYALTSKGVKVTSLLRQSYIEWRCVRRVCATGEGVRLSRNAKTSALDAYRSVFLRYDGNRDEVLRAIEELRADR
jgi:hypothetical protein